MGLFVLPLGKTAEENVRQAEANLKIFWENPQENAHTLSFAIGCLEAAQEKLKKVKSDV